MDSFRSDQEQKGTCCAPTLDAAHMPHTAGERSPTPLGDALGAHSRRPFLLCGTGTPGRALRGTWNSDRPASRPARQREISAVIGRSRPIACPERRGPTLWRLWPQRCRRCRDGMAPVCVSALIRSRRRACHCVMKTFVRPLATPACTEGERANGRG